MINNLNLLALNIHFQIFIKNKSISFYQTQNTENYYYNKMN